MKYGYNSQQYLTYNKSNIVGYTKVAPPNVPLQSTEHAWKFDFNLKKWRQFFVTQEYIDQAKTELILEIHNIRKVYQLGGINISGFKDFPMFSIGTDLDDTTTLSNAILSMTLGVITTVNWKTASGIWIQLDSVDIVKLAGIIANYVEQCFDKEMELVERVRTELNTINDINNFRNSLLSHWPDKNKVFE